LGLAPVETEFQLLAVCVGKTGIISDHVPSSASFFMCGNLLFLKYFCTKDGIAASKPIKTTFFLIFLYYRLGY